EILCELLEFVPVRLLTEEGAADDEYLLRPHGDVGECTQEHVLSLPPRQAPDDGDDRLLRFSLAFALRCVAEFDAGIRDERFPPPGDQGFRGGSAIGDVGAA